MHPLLFKAKTHQVPLPFDAAKLNGLSERNIGSHRKNNYGFNLRRTDLVRPTPTMLRMRK